MNKKLKITNTYYTASPVSTRSCLTMGSANTLKSRSLQSQRPMNLYDPKIRASYTSLMLNVFTNSLYCHLPVPDS